MINLRYHIVSLTAVFLAIGIGLTLGSTFLDRATVDNLSGQLEGLESRLDDRNQQIDVLEGDVEDAGRVQSSLDEQASGLLAGRLDGVPVVLLAARGINEAEINGAAQALLLSGAQLQGEWWFTERLLLGSDADVTDLAAVLGSSSLDPARLRRDLVGQLGGDLRGRQARGVDGASDPSPDGAPDGAPPEAAPDPAAPDTTPPADPATDPAGDPGVDPATDPTAEGADIAEESADDAPAVPPLVAALTSGGFLDFQPVPGSADEPVFPNGTRIVIVGGSTKLPDDLFFAPFIERLARDAEGPVLATVASAGDGELADLVSVIRDDERLRSIVPTVDSIAHFQGWAALVLSLRDVADGVVGHYGLGEGAGRLLPPIRAS